jgi:hydroxyethylthiazole kinase-like sugar kinase family protein
MGLHAADESTLQRSTLSDQTELPLVSPDSGCMNNGVNSTRMECVNATHARNLGWSGTSCTGTPMFTSWVGIGCMGNGAITCSTVSGAAATSVAAAALALAVAALLASARKHE